MKYIAITFSLVLMHCHLLFASDENDFTLANDSIVYVWDFSVNNAEMREVALMLTSDFETELIQSNLYTVLQRRRYDKVLAHQKMEDRISGVDGLSKQSKDSLQAIKAQIVVFGEVIDDIEDGRIEVKVSFQSLNSIILREGKVLFQRGDRKNNVARKKYMRQLFLKLHEKEITAAKNKELEKVSNLLSTYLVRVKNVQKSYQDVGQIALDEPRYFDELAEVINDYNLIFEQIHNNPDKIKNDFSSQWGATKGKELNSIIKYLLDDVHKVEVLRLDKVRIDIWEYYNQVESKKERKKLKSKITAKLNRITNELQFVIRELDSKTETFLEGLTTEIDEKI